MISEWTGGVTRENVSNTSVLLFPQERLLARTLFTQTGCGFLSHVYTCTCIHDVHVMM